MTDRLLAAVLDGIRIHDLGRELFAGMPQSPSHPTYTRTYPRRHGDAVRVDGGSAANDLLVMGTHVGTHIDALAHVSHDGLLHDGVDAQEEGRIGFPTHGAHTIEPMVRRGVLLDIPATLGLEVCQPGYEVTVDDVVATCERQSTPVGEGDVVLVRTGWGRRFDDGFDAYAGHESGVPGIGESAARWLAERGVHTVGGDSNAVEHLPAGAGHSRLPAHRVLLVEHGVYIIETLELEALAAAGVHEFTFVLAPLRLRGATGSPVRPLAVVSE